MANSLETIFPRQANNDYRGGTVAFYGFLLIIAQHAFSAFRPRQATTPIATSGA